MTREDVKQIIELFLDETNNLAKEVVDNPDLSKKMILGGHDATMGIILSRIEEKLLPHQQQNFAESEDERIKKAIQYAICQSTHKDNILIDGVTKNEALAWLEKQKEQKSAEWSETDKEMLAVCIDAVGSMSIRSDVQALRDWLKSLPIRFNLYPKPAEWTEEDEDGFKCVANCLSTFYYLTDDVVQRDKIDSAEIWLNKIATSHRPNYWKPKQEWDEEDEFQLEEAIEAVLETNYSDKRKANVITWLKFLRPHPHWKPTKEQMEALKHIVYNTPMNEFDLLEQLYKELKRL